MNNFDELKRKPGPRGLKRITFSQLQMFFSEEQLIQKHFRCNTPIKACIDSYVTMYNEICHFIDKMWKIKRTEDSRTNLLFPPYFGYFSKIT